MEMKSCIYFKIILSALAILFGPLFLLPFGAFVACLICLWEEDEEEFLF